MNISLQFVIKKPTTMNLLSARYHQNRSCVIPPKAPMQTLKQIGSHEVLPPISTFANSFHCRRSTYELTEESIKKEIIEQSESEEIIRMEDFDLFL